MRFAIKQLDFFERPVRLRMPFRFGVVTLTEAPQAFVRARIRLENGTEAEGAAAELLAPKWFDKNPALSNEDNFEQLRNSMRQARTRTFPEAWTLLMAIRVRASAWWRISALRSSIVRCSTPVPRARISRSMKRSRRTSRALPFPGSTCRASCEALKPGNRIAARHTVGLVDPITSLDNKTLVNDGLPETLEEVIARYGHRWFKLKVGGDVKADVERLRRHRRGARPHQAGLTRPASTATSNMRMRGASLDRCGGREGRAQAEAARIEHRVHRAADQAAERASRCPRVRRCRQGVVQGVAGPGDHRRVRRLARRISAREGAWGTSGVSSKTCKGLYKSLINAARCKAWGDGYFMTGEDLTIQAGHRAAAGSRAGFTARPHACRAQRPPLRERHGGPAPSMNKTGFSMNTRICMSAATAPCACASTEE